MKIGNKEEEWFTGNSQAVIFNSYGATEKIFENYR